MDFYRRLILHPSLSCFAGILDVAQEYGALNASGIFIPAHTKILAWNSGKSRTSFCQFLY